MISIIICLYDEKENVEELTRRIYASVKTPFELIYAVDGDDGTYDTIKKMNNRKNMKVSYSGKKRGFKNAFIAGYKLVGKKSNKIVTLDGDLNHRPEEIEKLLRVNADIVIGSRYLKESKVRAFRLWKRVMSIFANRLLSSLFKMNINDNTSGLRAYKKKKLDDIVSKCNESENFEFQFELLLLAHKNNYKIAEVPISFEPRTKGKSKFELLNVMMGYARLMKYVYRNWLCRWKKTRQKSRKHPVGPQPV